MIYSQMIEFFCFNFYVSLYFFFSLFIGVQTVEMNIEKGEIKAKGKLDPLKILKLIEKKSNNKVELISPKVKPKEIIITDKKPKETKDVSIYILFMI